MSVSRRTVLATAAGAGAAAACTFPAPAAAAAGGGTSGATLRTLRATADYAVEKLSKVAPGVTAFPVGTKSPRCRRPA